MKLDRELSKLARRRVACSCCLSRVLKGMADLGLLKVTKGKLMKGVQFDRWLSKVFCARLNYGSWLPKIAYRRARPNLGYWVIEVSLLKSKNAIVNH